MKRAQQSQHFRLPVAFVARLNLYAAQHGITVSAAMRIAAQRGLLLLEEEASRPAPTETTGAPLPPQPRRRILSPGL